MLESLITNSHSWMENIDREVEIPQGALMRRARFATKACLQSWRIPIAREIAKDRILILLLSQGPNIIGF